MQNIKVLNIDILSISLGELLSIMHDGVLFTPNVDHLVKLQKDREFYDAYSEADWIVCDSKIVNAAAGFLGAKFEEVIPGSSFLPAFCNYHKNDSTKKIFLLGAAEGVAQKAMKNINERVGRNMVVGELSPPYGFEHDSAYCEYIINQINKSTANVLVVGLGAPKQEKWIKKYRDRLSGIKIIMALGATIDFEAGYIKRAPFLLQKLGLEWLFRLAKEPRRLWKRYLVDDFPFFLYIFKQKMGKYKNPFKPLID